MDDAEDTEWTETRLTGYALQRGCNCFLNLSRKSVTASFTDPTLPPMVGSGRTGSSQHTPEMLKTSMQMISPQVRLG